MNNITNLNNPFGIGKQLVFATTPSGQTVITINNQQASATIALQGAHLMSWQPVDAEAVIWLSADAKLAPGKSIRGGMPICWPWFGAHATEPAFPAHGFARTADWDVIASASLPGGTTEIIFELALANNALTQWPNPTSVRYRITVGKTLSMELITHNTGPTAITISEALHTYFTVSDVRKISIDGLDGCHYLDKVDEMKERQQSGAVTFAGEVDRIYIDSEDDCIIHDPALSRQIRISKTGSRSTVVWNPWIEKSIQMGDMGEVGYLNMVCIESANAADNSITIPAGGEHRLTVNYSVERA